MASAANAWSHCGPCLGAACGRRRRDGARDRELAATAVAMTTWHANHPRAPCVGPHRAPQGRLGAWCERDKKEHYPRTDPAVIVAITDPDDGCCSRTRRTGRRAASLTWRATWSRARASSRPRTARCSRRRGCVCATSRTWGRSRGRSPPRSWWASPRPSTIARLRARPGRDQRGDVRLARGDRGARGRRHRHPGAARVDRAQACSRTGTAGRSPMLVAARSRRRVAAPPAAGDSVTSRHPRLTQWRQCLPTKSSKPSTPSSARSPPPCTAPCACSRARARARPAPSRTAWHTACASAPSTRSRCSP